MTPGRLIYSAFLAFALVGSAAFYLTRAQPPETILAPENLDQITAPENLISYDWSAAPARQTLSGSYLAGHFAQSRNDWQTANDYLSFVLEKSSTDDDLLKRSMILAVGTGDFVLATARAHSLRAAHPQDGLALMVLAIDDLAQGDYAQAVHMLEGMKTGDITDYIQPLLEGWAKAGLGQAMADDLDSSFIHAFHGAIISLYLGDKEKARSYIAALLSSPGINNLEIERAADLLALSGNPAEAVVIYEQLLPYQSETLADLKKKIALLKADPDHPEALYTIVPFLDIKTPAQGAALAMFDMAHLLTREESDNSARIFTYMALQLNPDLVEPHLLLAGMAARAHQFDEAIAQLALVPPGHAQYLDSQRAAADFLAESGREDEAKALLNKLFTEFDDLQSLIRLGDLYRHDENFGEALKIYNRATRKIGEPIPEDYWYLLYARGMAYERDGQWPNAEKDLKAALIYRPDHPYLLNYLGYGWADQGLNLDKALGMIERAVALRPDDGYIIDSLGWVYYMMGRYEDAIPYLEKGVALLPTDMTMNDHLGDAYWQAGRRLEARFQWERALNSADKDNADQIKDAALIGLKLRYGLNIPDEAKNALNDPLAAPTKTE